MARLPVPGSDNNAWGDVLNDFLGQSHNANGSLKPSAISASGAAVDSSVVHNTGTETIAGVKTFSAPPVIGSITNTGTLTLPTSTDTLVGRATTDTLTNKTISGASNTISAIPESAVTNLTTDLAGKELSANKGQANGYASLDSTSKVPAAQIPDLSATYLMSSNQLARDRRALPAGFDLSTDGLPVLTATGLTTVSGYIAASVGGTNGDAILPILGTRKEFRASFRVKATKSTASSRSTVGFTVSNPGVLPSSGTFTFTVGYLAGTGLAFIRDNVGAAVIILADSSITDGTEYDICIWSDKALSGSTVTTGALYARVRTVSGTDVAVSSTSFNIVNFPITNVLVRTNVAAGGITNLQIANHPLSEVGVPVAGEPVTAAGGETAFMHIPAKPNGKMIFALHGHGGSPFETGWSSTSYKSSWDAAIAEGFSVVVPKMGGDLWGNDVALAYVVALYTFLVAQYDFDPGAYLWGNSMGGGAAATLIAKRPIPIRAAYLAQPAVNYQAISANPSFATINTAYPTSADRDDNDPLKQTGSAYAGVPLLITSSTSDTAIPKASNADSLVTLAGAYTSIIQIAATGNHNDTSHFRPYDMVNFFKANL